jgi:hypothetical protein
MKYPPGLISEALQIAAGGALIGLAFYFTSQSIALSVVLGSAPALWALWKLVTMRNLERSNKALQLFEGSPHPGIFVISRYCSDIVGSRFHSGAGTRLVEMALTTEDQFRLFSDTNLGLPRHLLPLLCDSSGGVICIDGNHFGKAYGSIRLWDGSAIAGEREIELSSSAQEFLQILDPPLSSQID